MSRILRDDIENVLSLLPSDLAILIREEANAEPITEIVLDYGRYPEIRNPQGSVIFEDYMKVDHSLINRVLANETLGQVGKDNRAGIEGTLHRISVVKERTNRVIGMTIRLGKVITGNCDIVADLIKEDSNVLFLGKPNVGKTSLLREFCSMLSLKKDKRVVIVDTSNEIAGEGLVPHEAVGYSRRLMVPFDRKQYEVMLEAVENHGPEVIVIDEISTSDEAEAACTISERGVNILASAHGTTLANLIDNAPLSALLGKLKVSTLTDANAEKINNGRKTHIERVSAPCFDKIVEIVGFDEVIVYHDVQKAVDTLLEGGTPEFENRKIDASGKVSVTKSVPYIELYRPKLEEIKPLDKRTSDKVQYPERRENDRIRNSGPRNRREKFQRRKHR